MKIGSVVGREANQMNNIFQQNVVNKLQERNTSKINSLVENTINNRVQKRNIDTLTLGKVRSLIKIPGEGGEKDKVIEIKDLQEYLDLMEDRHFNIERAIKFGMDPDAAQKMLEREEGFDEKFAIEHGMDPDEAHEMAIYGKLNFRFTPKDEGDDYTWAEHALGYFESVVRRLNDTVDYIDTVEEKMSLIGATKEKIADFYSVNSDAEKNAGKMDDWLQKCEDLAKEHYTEHFRSERRERSQVEVALESNYGDHGLGRYLCEDYNDRLNLKELGLSNVGESREQILSDMEMVRGVVEKYIQKTAHFCDVASAGQKILDKSDGRKGVNAGTIERFSKYLDRIYQDLTEAYAR